MKKFDLAIFDMDGLMFDTGRIAYNAYLKTAEQFDIEMRPEVYYFLTGRNDEGIRQAMKELYGEEQDIAAWRKAMVHFKNEIIAASNRVYKKPGLVSLLAYLKANDKKVGLASSSKREEILSYLEMENLDATLFDVIVAGDEVRNSKPDPEIFLKVCRKIGIAPEDTLVFEDSLVGVEAANAAGIKTVLVEDDINDMPSHDGKIKLKWIPSVIRKDNQQPAFQFDSLSDAEFYMENNE